VFLLIKYWEKQKYAFLLDYMVSKTLSENFTLRLLKLTNNIKTIPAGSANLAPRPIAGFSTWLSQWHDPRAIIRLLLKFHDIIA